MYYITKLEYKLKKSSLVILLYLFCSISAQASVQTVIPKGGGAIYIELPSKGLTLIKFEYGKVLRIRHNAEELLVEADSDKGEAYIKAKKPNSKDAISFYVINEKYTLPFIAKINPKLPPAGSIVILNEAPKVAATPAAPLPLPAPELTASHHVRQIKEALISAMGSKPVGFNVTEIQKDISNKNGIRIVHEKTFRNTLHTVEQYALHNLSDADIKLFESQFYTVNVLAVTIQFPNLPSGHMTPIYIVKATQ